MKRIIIIGQPGSGKTYTAQQLMRLKNIGLYAVDDLAGRLEDQIISQQVIAAFDEIQQKREWIIDGIVHCNARKHLSKADTVIFLERPLLARVFRVIRRWCQKKILGEPNGSLVRLLQLLWHMVRMNARATVKYRHLFLTLPDHVNRVWLRGDTEVEIWLAQFVDLQFIQPANHPNPIVN